MLVLGSGLGALTTHNLHQQLASLSKNHTLSKSSVPAMKYAFKTSSLVPSEQDCHSFLEILGSSLPLTQTQVCLTSKHLLFPMLSCLFSL